MLLASSAAVGASLMFWLLRPSEAPWMSEFADPQWRFPERTPPTMTEEAAARCRRIQNDLLLRRVWGEAEIQEIERIIHAGYQRSDPGRRIVDKDRISTRMVFDAAFLALWNRLDHEQSMTPEARARGVKIVLDETVAEYPDRRRTGAGVLISTKLVEDPSIRAAVESLLKDEDDQVAEIVALRLAEYDRQKAAWLKRQAVREK